MPELSTLEIEEYKSLREEIAAKLKSFAQFQLYALAATGGVWAWLLAGDHRSATPYAWFIPVLLVLFSGLHSWSEWKSLRIIAEYLRLREEAYSAAKVGLVQMEYWETWRWKRSSREESLAWAFWGFLALATVVGGIVGYCYDSPQPPPNSPIKPLELQLSAAVSASV